MVHYRYQNKKAFLVDRISSCRHTLCAIDNTSELLRQSNEPRPLKACLSLLELQLAEVSELYLPVSLVCQPFVGPPLIGIYLSQWAGHFQRAIPGGIFSPNQPTTNNSLLIFAIFTHRFHPQ